MQAMAFARYWTPVDSLHWPEVLWLYVLGGIVGLLNPTIGLALTVVLAFTRLRRNSRARWGIVLVGVALLAARIIVDVGYQFWP